MKSYPILYSSFVISLVIIFSSCSKTPAVGSYNNTVGKTADKQVALISDNLTAEDSIVIRGDTSHGDESALIQSRRNPYLRDNNYVNYPAFVGETWTWDGVPGANRSLMKFNFDRIPASLRNHPPLITHALLYLYQYQRDDGLDIYGVQQTTPNPSEIHRIRESWSSHTVTWNNQPAVASGSANVLEDVVTIPAITTPLPANTRDDVMLDVTAMVQRIISDKINQGFLIKTADPYERQPYCGRSFGSFACPEQNKKPRLVLYYIPE